MGKGVEGGAVLGTGSAGRLWGGRGRGKACDGAAVEGEEGVEALCGCAISQALRDAGPEGKRVWGAVAAAECLVRVALLPSFGEYLRLAMRKRQRELCGYLVISEV